MDEKSLKMAVWQRVVIVAVAVLMVGSLVMSYMLIVMGASSGTSQELEERVADLTLRYDEKNKEIQEAAKPLSDKYFAEFSKYKTEVKAYNEAAATNAVLQTEDLKEGNGKELAEGDKDYAAYYIGWCADGTVFDSSLETFEEPKSLKAPIEAANGLIEGWEQGVVGMKLGGVRKITMNGDLAYGETREICGGYNKPLKFLVMPLAVPEDLKALNKELSEIFQELYKAYAAGA